MSYKRQNSGSKYRPTPRLNQTMNAPIKAKSPSHPNASKLSSKKPVAPSTLGLSNEDLLAKVKSLKPEDKWVPPVSGLCKTCKEKQKNSLPKGKEEKDEKSKPEGAPEKVVEIDEQGAPESGGGGGGQPNQQQQGGQGKGGGQNSKDKSQPGQGKDQSKKDKGQQGKDPQQSQGQDSSKDAQQGNPQSGQQQKPEGDEGEDDSGPSPEDVQRAKEGGSDVNGEFNQITSGGMKDDGTTADFEPVVAAGDPSIYLDQQFIAEMNLALKDWRTGFTDKTGATGSRLSVKQYIKTKGDEPFISRIQKSAKGKKVLFILDFSGSQYPTIDEYKRAVASSGKVLDSIGTNTAVFVFGSQLGQDNSPSFLRVKKFEEPTWLPLHSARVAGLDAGGSTPTHKAYKSLNDYVRRHHPDATITITDGAPDDEASTKEEIRKLRSSTKMVAFGIGSDMNTTTAINEKLQGFGYNKVFAQTGMSGLAPKIIQLIAPK